MTINLNGICERMMPNQPKHPIDTYTLVTFC